MYSDVVMGLSKARFEEIIDEMKKEKGIEYDVQFDAVDFKKMIVKFKEFYKKELKQVFPDDPKTQLFGAINAVFQSWENPRANYYRKINEIPSNWGTAVNVQSMVYGNMGETSGTGVAFTRNPATAKTNFMGEFLMNDPRVRRGSGV
jgi:pyruvate,orthophosphate dikinase